MEVEVTSVKAAPSSVIVGSPVTCTWNYTGAAATGNLSLVDETTKAATVISSAINLTSLSYSYQTTTPGDFWFSLSDGTSNSLSNVFHVLTPAQASASSTGAPSPSDTSSPNGGSPGSSAKKSAASAKSSFTVSNKLLIGLIMIVTVMMFFA
ncbi:8450_t:CDS:2 [Scutellospora calospora]|uniref:8450_t:CDS:1 n=1 Tax=Scutellospora calospora TaxID=85575 RepID=A0ACA9KAG5_9GLOM|nr:8450_t:CDS:2 [Scutellospora calospora]